MNIKLDGLSIHYTAAGQGCPVILLHGWGASSQTFQPVQEDLSKGFRVYALDLPGFGESDEPPVPWGIEEYTALLRSFIKALDLEKPILIGHSNGGRISIQYGSQFPVRKLVLIDSAGIKPKRNLKYYAKVYTYKTAKNVIIPLLGKKSDAVLDKMKGKFGSTDYKSVSGVMQQTMVKLVNLDLKHLMPQNKAPTLLVWGDQDTATPLSDGQTMEKLFPNAGLVVLKNTGHFSYLEKPREFSIIVNHFLNEDKGGGHA